MDCAEFESTLADYVDGTLGAIESAQVELHAATCAGCREFKAEVMGAASLLKRVEEVEPPADLITRIAFQTPRGRTRGELDPPGFWAEWKTRWVTPLLQPRLAMGMAMTVLSFSMLAKCTGVPQVQHLSAADLSPGHLIENLEDRVVRTKDRLVKNYENLRVVYEIESRLNEVEKQQGSTGDQSKQQQDGQGGQK